MKTYLRSLVNDRSLLLLVCLAFLGCSLTQQLRKTLPETRIRHIEIGNQLEEVLLPIEIPPLLEDPPPRWQPWSNDLWMLRYCTGARGTEHDHVDIGFFYRTVGDHPEVMFLFVAWIIGDPWTEVKAWVYIEGQPIKISFDELNKKLGEWLMAIPEKKNI